ESPQAVPVLPLAEKFLDLLPAPLRQTIAFTASASAHDLMCLSVPSLIDGNVWCDPFRQQTLDEFRLEETLVAAKRGGSESEYLPSTLQQAKTPLPLRSHPPKYLDPDTNQDSVAVLHHGVDGIAGISTSARASLGNIAAIRVGGRPMSGVAALLSTEVDRPVARILWPLGVALVLFSQPPLVLLRADRDSDRSEALEAGIGPNERAVTADVFADETLIEGLLESPVEHLLKETGSIEPPTSVLAEGRRVPGIL